MDGARAATHAQSTGQTAQSTSSVHKGWQQFPAGDTVHIAHPPYAIYSIAHGQSAMLRLQSESAFTPPLRESDVGVVPRLNPCCQKGWRSTVRRSALATLDGIPQECASKEKLCIRLHFMSRCHMAQRIS